MNDEQFIGLLDELGGKLALWPAHLQKDALALLKDSAGARSALDAMKDVESLLALTTHVPHCDIGAIAALAMRHGQNQRPILGPALRKASFAALGALALAAGILVGMTPPSATAIVGSVQMALNGGGSDVW